MNKIIIPLVIAFVLNACSRKETASSGAAETNVVATNSQSTVDSKDKAVGKWLGNWETKTPQEANTPMELVLSEKDGHWSCECKFTYNGNQSSNTRDVTVDSDGRIAFRCNFASDSEFHFSGEVNGSDMKGSVEIFEKSRKVAAGTWKAKRG